MADLKIKYINRKTGEIEEETIYKSFAIELLYRVGSGTGFLGALCAFFLLPLFARLPFFSNLYGYLQKRSASKEYIAPFIKKFNVDSSEFLKKVEDFTSFNDFFTRELRQGSRPIVDQSIVLPADGRYLVIDDISKTDGFFIKGQQFDLSSFLQDEVLAKKYARGSMVIARLCPTDYHRFHFPCDGKIKGKPRLINGPLYSVNPLALRKNLQFIAENKRYITEIESKIYGTLLFVEVGATNVGTVVQTYEKNRAVKGAEKGYFAFGGSCIVMLFENGKILFDDDLIRNSLQYLETFSKVGQSLGRPY